MDAVAVCTASSLRPVMVTVAPSLESSAAARCPTGPVPASTTACLPRSDRPCASHATAAAAVVFDPLQSNIMETRNLPKNLACTAASSAWPAAMLPPPMNRAVFFLSLGPRVNIAPSTSPPTLAAVTPP